MPAEAVMDAASLELGDAIGSAIEETAIEPEAPTDGELFAEETPVEVTETSDTPEGEVAEDPNAPYKLTEDGSAYQVPKQDFEIMQGMREYAEKTQNLFPTVQDAEIARREALDLRAIRTDWTNGEQPDIDAILGYLSGVDETDPTYQQQFRQSFAKMATRMPDYLRAVDQNAYGSLESAVIQQKTNALYEHAAKTQNPEDLFKAQQFDHAMTGRYKTEKDLPVHDPVAEERAKFEADRALIQRQRADMMNRDWQNFDATVANGSKMAQFKGEVEKLLDPLKGKYTERHINSIRKDVIDDTIAAMKRDSEWTREHMIEYTNIQKAYQAAWNNRQSADGLKPRIQRWQNDFLTRARRYLPSVAKQVTEQIQLPPVAAGKTRTQPPKTAPAKPGTAAAKPVTKPGDIWGGVFA
jgi:hypothetical protein